MKKNIINILLGVAGLSMMSTAFAGASSYGIDGDEYSPDVGRISVDGTLVGSCTAPVINLDLGQIDFHVAKNGPTGVHERLVNINVNCTNPNQVWSIATYTGSFNLESGVSGSNADIGYVSLSSPITTPGTRFTNQEVIDASMVTIFSQYQGGQLTLAEAQAQYQNVLSNQVIETMFASSTGTSSIEGKLTFGKNLPAGSVANMPYDGSQATGGVPSGTIDGRGAFAVDVPLIIYY